MSSECQHCHLQIRKDDFCRNEPAWIDVGTEGDECPENIIALATFGGGNTNILGPHEPITPTSIVRTPAMEANCCDLDYYQWRQPVMYDGDFRLLLPHSDPALYEDPFNFIFRTKQEAYDGLETWGVEDDAREEHWILVHYTGEIVGE